MRLRKTRMTTSSHIAKAIRLAARNIGDDARRFACSTTRNRLPRWRIAHQRRLIRAMTSPHDLFVLNARWCVMNVNPKLSYPAWLVGGAARWRPDARQGLVRDGSRHRPQRLWRSRSAYGFGESRTPAGLTEHPQGAWFLANPVSLRVTLSIGCSRSRFPPRIRESRGRKKTRPSVPYY